MEQWQEEGFDSQEQCDEYYRSMYESEAEAEFIMSYVAGGGLPSEAKIAWYNYNH